MLNYRAICSSLLDLWHDRSGNVAVMTALMMPVLGGMGALGVEVGLWYQ
jgi:Flp pilus assembly protein TadG